MNEELELQQIKLDIKQGLLETAAEEEKDAINWEIEAAQTRLRELLVDIRYERRNVEQWQDSLDAAIEEDASMKIEL